MTWIQTSSGRAFDLLAPRAEDLDFRDVAVHLARIARFSGGTAGLAYSVAQHCVLGADDLFRSTGRTDLAAAFVLHDAHEFAIGDDSRPKQEALEHLLPSYREALAALKQPIDAVIHAAAGIPWPLSPSQRAAVHDMDLRMLATERRDAMAPPPKPWAAVVEAAVPLRSVIKPWPWPRAADEWLDRLARYCPAALDRAA